MSEQLEKEVGDLYDTLIHLMERLQADGMIRVDLSDILATTKALRPLTHERADEEMATVPPRACFWCSGTGRYMSTHDDTVEAVSVECENCYGTGILAANGVE